MKKQNLINHVLRAAAVFCIVFSDMLCTNISVLFSNLSAVQWSELLQFEKHEGFSKYYCDCFLSISY